MECISDISFFIFSIEKKEKAMCSKRVVQKA